MTILFSPPYYKLDNLTKSKSYIGVSRENISCIVRGDSWQHVGGPRTKRWKVSLEDIEKMIELYKQGFSRKEISEQTGWKYQTVYKYTK